MAQPPVIEHISSDKPRPLQRKVLLGFLLTVSVGYAILLSYHMTVPLNPKGKASVLDECRVLCMQYGLIPTGHVANDARAYLQVFKPWDLSGDLSELLSDKEFIPAQSHEHRLLGQTAPDFTLLNDSNQPLKLSEQLKNGPVVLVFYYGYYCSHCVAQLFVLNDDLRHFRELGAEVIAVSPDSPEDTAKAYQKYGRFNFPVLSDPDNQQAVEYGVYKAASPGKDEEKYHATFVIGTNGKIAWAYTGHVPNTDNKSLLFVLAKERGVQLPPSATDTP